MWETEYTPCANCGKDIFIFVRTDGPDKIYRCDNCGHEMRRRRVRYLDTYCPKCEYYVDDQEGYIEAKNWVYCPYCGRKLVNRIELEELR